MNSISDNQKFDKDNIKSISNLVSAEVLAGIFRAASHDIMNQLAALKLNGDLVHAYPERYNAEGFWKRISPMIDGIENSVVHARMLNRKILDPNEFSLTKINLIDIVIVVLEAYQSRAEKRGIKFSFAYPESPVPVQADEMAIREGLISALISNSIKFSKNDGKISISLLRDNNSAILTIRDEGIGMPEEWVPLLTDSLNRENMRRRGLDGTMGFGFGLVVANLVARYFGGTLEVKLVQEDKNDPEASRGTESRVVLPIFEK